VVRRFEAAGALQESDRFFAKEPRHVSEADAAQRAVAFLGLLQDCGADRHHADAEAVADVIDQQVEVARIDHDVQRMQDTRVAELLVELRATVRGGDRPIRGKMDRFEKREQNPSDKRFLPKSSWSVILDGKSFLFAECYVDGSADCLPGCRDLCQMTPFESQKHDQFLRLYIENETALRGFVRSLVPTLQDVDDVMQETAAVLWRKFDDLDSPANFRRWAFGVARFEVLVHRRDRARDRHVFGDELMALLEAEAMAAGEHSGQELLALESCLTKLPHAQRALLEAAYAPGVRIDEMARNSGRTAMSIYKALHRIRILLVDCVRQTMATEGMV